MAPNGRALGTLFISCGRERREEERQIVRLLTQDTDLFFPCAHGLSRGSWLACSPTLNPNVDGWA